MFRLRMKKIVSAGSVTEGERREKESGSQALGRTTSGSGRSLFPRHVFFGFLFVSGGITRAVGELSEGNTDINLP